MPTTAQNSPGGVNIRLSLVMLNEIAEVTTSRLKPGCAEGAIVNGLAGMMNQY